MSEANTKKSETQTSSSRSAKEISHKLLDEKGHQMNPTVKDH